MILTKDKDPMGAAIADFYQHGKAGKLRVFSPDFDEDEIPVETLFREYDEMPSIEQTALRMASGRILDVGAGSGCHSLALQDMQKDVVAVDISPSSVDVMRESGVRDVRLVDFYEMKDERFDTVLMLMNGAGIIGSVDNIHAFFDHLNMILADGGQLLMDSSDIRYVFEDEDGSFEINLNDRYYGELEYKMQYKRIVGDSFTWLYIDFATLQSYAEEYGWQAELVAEGEHYEYLARITRRTE
ncbi:MAG: class I SAM-dependent methyltransferase [Bacteroidaceae bacterium]|nr:class I SAM-dependent methyltransferase [Bacteroidaceae bacterium]